MALQKPCDTLELVEKRSRYFQARLLSVVGNGSTEFRLGFFMKPVARARLARILASASSPESILDLPDLTSNSLRSASLTQALSTPASLSKLSINLLRNKTFRIVE